MEKISLSAKSLDDLLGGGLETGIITNFYGAAGSGKTNIVIQAAVNCTKMGNQVVYVDAEGGFSVERFLQMHKKDALKDIILIEPKSFDDQDQKICSIENIINNRTGLIIVDSMVALYRLELRNDKISDVNRRLSKQFAVLSKIAREKKIIVIVTNQVYSDFETGDLELVGRDIPKYSSKCLVLLEKIGNSKRRATLMKHRSRPEGITAEFEIKNEGLTNLEKRFKIF